MAQTAQSVAVDTGTGSSTTQATPGVRTPPSGPLSSPLDEAASYALQLHNEFWASVPAKKRAQLITRFVARAKVAGAAGTADVAKALVQGLGVGVAAANLAGYETQQWILVDGAGPRTGLVPGFGGTARVAGHLAGRGGRWHRRREQGRGINGRRGHSAHRPFPPNAQALAPSEGGPPVAG